MPKRPTPRIHRAPPRIIWREPLDEVVAECRREAAVLREALHTADADRLERWASKVEAAIERASREEWYLTEVVAPLLLISPDAVRTRCRRSLEARGLARKQGGVWYVHASAITGAKPESQAA